MVPPEFFLARGGDARLSQGVEWRLVFTGRCAKGDVTFLRILIDGCMGVAIFAEVALSDVSEVLVEASVRGWLRDEGRKAMMVMVKTFERDFSLVGVAASGWHVLSQIDLGNLLRIFCHMDRLGLLGESLRREVACDVEWRLRASRGYLPLLGGSSLQWAYQVISKLHLHSVDLRSHVLLPLRCQDSIPVVEILLNLSVRLRTRALIELASHRLLGLHLLPLYSLGSGLRYPCVKLLGLVGDWCVISIREVLLPHYHVYFDGGRLHELSPVVIRNEGGGFPVAKLN